MIIRKVIHVDMDAFYASVEQRDFPKLRGQPIAVGGSAERGVVAAASYEARKFGVRSAMPSKMAAQRCPGLIFVKPRFEVYKKVSLEINSIFKTFTDLVEPLALDEAYLDVTENKIGLPSATIIAQEIRKQIFEKTHLTASAGISINKFLAKVASDINKPNGQKLISPEEALPFVEALAVAKFPYVGKKTAERMYLMGIYKGKDLKNKSLEQLVRLFGKHGHYYYKVVRCEQDQPVVANRIRKSVGAESTFEHDLVKEQEIMEKVRKIEKEVWRRIMNSNVLGRTITLKIKDHQFKQSTRSKTAIDFVKTEKAFNEIVKELLYTPCLPDKPIRLLGVSVSNLNTVEPLPTSAVQLTLEF